MISYETHILPNSDYYVYTPSTLAKKLFFYPICTGSFRYESGYRLARDSYDSFLLMYILKGTCFVTWMIRQCRLRQVSLSFWIAMRHMPTVQIPVSKLYV